MKKVLYIAMLLIAVMVTSCSSSYDQKKVDEVKAKLEQGQATEADAKALVEQINLALDEAEKADDIIKWANDNKDKAAAIDLTGSFYGVEELGYSEETVKAIKDVTERANALAEKILKAEFEAAGFDDSEEMEYEDEGVEVEEASVEAEAPSVEVSSAAAYPEY